MLTTVTQIRLSLNISKSFGDSVSTSGAPVGNRLWQIERSRDPEGQVRDQDIKRYMTKGKT